MSLAVSSAIQCLSNVNKSKVLEYVDSIVSSGNTVYHINTRFSLRQIGKERDIYSLQYAYPNLVISNFNTSSIFTFVVSNTLCCDALYRVNNTRDS